MYSLVAVVVAIVVTVLTAAAVVFYGGDAFLTGGAKAAYVQNRSAAVQIEAALRLYQAETGAYPQDEVGQTAIDKLVASSYLSSPPPAASGQSVGWSVRQNYILRPVGDGTTGIAQCKFINKGAGVGEVAPVCGGPDDNGEPCCTCEGATSPSGDVFCQ